MANKKKIAIVISHVIQHFIHLYENWSLNSDWDTKVFFGTKAGMEEYYDLQFKMKIKWDSSKLENINHTFIKNTSIHPDEFYEKGIIERSLEQFNPDFILIYGYSQTLQRRAKSWANRKGVKVIYFADSELNHTRNIFKVILKKIFLTYYFKNINIFLVTGNSNEEYLLNYFVPKHKFIRSSYPIDILLYDSKWKLKNILNNGIRSKYGISSQEIIICMVGKFVPWKRQIDIVNALVLLDSKLNTKINLILIGTGELEEALRFEAKKCKNHSVIFQGFVTPEDLPDFYASTDIYIHASEIEPHSVAVSEATFMGCPILISDKCGSYGTNDDVQIGINGFVYKCGNIIELADMISYLIINKNIRESFSNNSHEITSRNQKNAHFKTLDTIKIIDEAMMV